MANLRKKDLVQFEAYQKYVDNLNEVIPNYELSIKARFNKSQNSTEYEILVIEKGEPLTIGSLGRFADNGWSSTRPKLGDEEFEWLLKMRSFPFEARQETYLHDIYQNEFNKYLQVKETSNRLDQAIVPSVNLKSLSELREEQGLTRKNKI